MSDDTVRLSPEEQLDTVNERIRLIRRKNGLTFGTDAYLLAAFVRSAPGARAVDLGSGTGILSLLLCARDKVRSVTAVEIQPAFAELTERNAALNRMTDRITVLPADVRNLTARDTGGEVALVVSNPPYLRAGTGRSNRFPEKETARHEVAGTVADFCAAAGRVLRTGGRFCVVWKPERLRELFSAMAANRLEPKRMTAVHADGQHSPCAVLVEAVKDGAPDLHITPPLFLYEPLSVPHSPRKLTAAAQKIYDSCEWFDRNSHKTESVQSL